MGLNTQSV